MKRHWVGQSVKMMNTQPETLESGLIEGQIGQFSGLRFCMNPQSSLIDELRARQKQQQHRLERFRLWEQQQESDAFSASIARALYLAPYIIPTEDELKHQAAAISMAD